MSTPCVPIPPSPLRQVISLAAEPPAHHLVGAIQKSMATRNSGTSTQSSMAPPPRDISPRSQSPPPHQGPRAALAGFRGTTLVGRNLARRTAPRAQQARPPVAREPLPAHSHRNNGRPRRPATPSLGSPAHLPGEFSARPASHVRRVAVSQRLLLLFADVHFWMLLE